MNHHHIGHHNQNHMMGMNGVTQMGINPMSCGNGQMVNGMSSGSLNGLKRCSGCGQTIIDRFYLFAIDRYWHTDCLKCSCCHANLNNLGQSCFTKHDMILCKLDYVRMFGTGRACAVCSQLIPANEYVMRVQGNVYHTHCFVCVQCHTPLNTGDRFNLINGKLLCEQDCHKILKGTNLVNPAPTVRKNSKLARQAAKLAKNGANQTSNMDMNSAAYL